MHPVAVETEQAVVADLAVAQTVVVDTGWNKPVVAAEPEDRSVARVDTHWFDFDCQPFGMHSRPIRPRRRPG